MTLTILWEQIAATQLRHRTWFWAVLLSRAHVIPAAFTSLSTDLLHVCFGLPGESEAL
jgi:hypothetical protein